MKIKSIITVTLFLGATGIIAGALFAPRKGAKRRSLIARRGQKFRDYIVDNYNDLSDAVSHPFENLEDETIRLRNKAHARMKKVKTEVNQ